MDKQLLCPRVLHIEPEQPDAARVFNFWLRTVEDFISMLQELRRDVDPVVNKKRIIIYCLSTQTSKKQRHMVLKARSNSESSSKWRNQILKARYVKKKNNVCAQHLLVSRCQAGGESILVFLHVLKGLC